MYGEHTPARNRRRSGTAHASATFLETVAWVQGAGGISVDW